MLGVIWRITITFDGSWGINFEVIFFFFWCIYIFSLSLWELKLAVYMNVSRRSKPEVDMGLRYSSFSKYVTVLQ